jgi:hypothetical protein
MRPNQNILSAMSVFDSSSGPAIYHDLWQSGFNDFGDYYPLEYVEKALLYVQTEKEKAPTDGNGLISEQDHMTWNKRFWENVEHSIIKLMILKATRVCPETTPTDVVDDDLICSYFQRLAIMAAKFFNIHSVIHNLPDKPLDPENPWRVLFKPLVHKYISETAIKRRNSDREAYILIYAILDVMK